MEQRGLYYSSVELCAQAILCTMHLLSYINFILAFLRSGNGDISHLQLYIFLQKVAGRRCHLQLVHHHVFANRDYKMFCYKMSPIVSLQASVVYFNVVHQLTCIFCCLNMAFAPKREIKSQTIKNALKRILVPAIIQHYPVVAVRALWETTTNEDMCVAEQLIASKRMQLHKVLLKHPNVHGFLSCITAMTLTQKQVIFL